DETFRTILIIEDESADAALLLRGFEKAQVLNPVVHLTNGDDALRYLAGKGQYADRKKYPLPALMLLDLKLPGMTGIQLLQWMRVQGEIKRIPVVVLTSDENPDTINAAYDLGANSYLVKPGNAAEINRMVQTIQRYWMKLNEPPPLVMRAEQQ
ncbi:MAG TPA: response regulator, partial [Candidatus Sulfotelmatobacter sp.]|nr:response regulator [Candidatus Sulfotelmatobacter sp.]